MLHAILCTFRPGGFAQAKSLREQHYAFLAAHRADIVEGGPLLGPDGIPTSMLIVVDTPTIEAAQDFISHEPYTDSGLFESVAIHRWSQVIPEPQPGYIENELAKERASHAAPTSGAQ